MFRTWRLWLERAAPFAAALFFAVASHSAWAIVDLGHYDNYADAKAAAQKACLAIYPASSGQSCIEGSANDGNQPDCNGGQQTGERYYLNTTAGSIVTTSHYCNTPLANGVCDASGMPYANDQGKCSANPCGSSGDPYGDGGPYTFNHAQHSAGQLYEYVSKNGSTCQLVNAKGSSGVSVCLGANCDFSSGGTSVSGWQYTGISSSSITPDSSTQGACASSGGTTACLTGSNGAPASASNPSQCGTVNGESVCLGGSSNPSPGTCSVTPGGQAFCVMSSDTASPSSPPVPNNGTPGTVAAPSAVITGVNGSGGNEGMGSGGTGGPLYAYGSGTVHGATNYGGGGSGSTTQPAPATTTCGHTGDDCNVKVDETGVPSASSAAASLAASGSSGLASAFSAGAVSAAAHEPFDQASTESSWLSKLNLPAAGTCSSLVWNWSNGKSITFPGAVGCNLLEKLKTFEAWGLGLWTVWSILMIIFRRSV